jgi:type III pantothenate kinase
VVGRTTEECIQSGVYYGAVAQIDGLVRRISREVGVKPLVLATGGLASVVAADSQTIDRVVPALTLQGLCLMEERARDRRRARGSSLPGRKRPA